MNVKHPAEGLLILIIGVTIFFPQLPIGSSQFSTDWAILYACMAPVLYCCFSNGCKRGGVGMYLMLFLFHLVSLFYACGVLNVRVNVGDFWTLFTEFRYIILICLACLCSFDVFYRFFDSFIKVGSIVLVGICFLEFFNVAGFASILGNYYSSQLHVDSMTNGAHRIVVTGSDPNVGGVILSFFFLYRFLSFFVNGRKKDLWISFVLLACIMQTSSRTVFIGVVCYVVLKLLTDTSIKKYIKVLILAFGGFLVILLIPYFEYLLSGIQTVMSVEGNSSFNARLNAWKYFLGLADRSKLLGWGPANQIIDNFPVDGEYVLLYFRYGLLGLLCYFFVNARMLFFPRVGKYLDNRMRLYGSYTKAMFFISLFVMLTNNFYSGKQLFTLYLAVLTIFYNQNLKLRYTKSN